MSILPLEFSNAACCYPKSHLYFRALTNSKIYVQCMDYKQSLVRCSHFLVNHGLRNQFSFLEGHIYIHCKINLA